MLPEVDVRKTIADYKALPEGAPYQLIDGELIMNAAPHWFHQKALSKLCRKMADFVDKHNLGEIEFSPVVGVLHGERCVSTRHRVYRERETPYYR
jgi:Uma2 family endonuclease